MVFGAENRITCGASMLRVIRHAIAVAATARIAAIAATLQARRDERRRVAITGAAGLRATNQNGVPLTAADAARSVGNPISLDNNLTIFGAGQFNFTQPTMLTGSRTITVLDKDQVTTFSGSFSEAVLSGVTGAGLTKLGRGTLVLSSTVNYTGATTIGTTTAEGGILRLSGTAALPMPTAGVLFRLERSE